MKKILFIIPSLSTGGTNSVLDSFYPLLKDKYDISVFAISHQPRNHNYTFDKRLLTQDIILSILYSKYNDQKGIFKLISFPLKILQILLRYIKIDLTILRSNYLIKKIDNIYDTVIAFQEGYATKFASMFKCSHKIAWIHCNYNNYLSKEISEENIYKKFKKIICVSQYTANIFSNRYPNLKNRTIYIYNIINKKRIYELAEQPIEDKRYIKNNMILLSVGRFSAVKRFKSIPAIASELKKRGINFKWYILGPITDTKENTIFLKNVKKFDIEDYVIWLGGKSNPYPYFKVADLYVCLSESEACPMVFKEAKLFGIPIVTTDFPSSYEFIHEGEGYITSFDKLSEAITTMIYKIEAGFKLKSYYDDSEDVLSKVYSVLDDDVHMSSININR